MLYQFLCEPEGGFVRGQEVGPLWGINPVGFVSVSSALGVLGGKYSKCLEYSTGNYLVVLEEVDSSTGKVVAAVNCERELYRFALTAAVFAMRNDQYLSAATLTANYGVIQGCRKMQFDADETLPPTEEALEVLKAVLFGFSAGGGNQDWMSNFSFAHIKMNMFPAHALALIGGIMVRKTFARMFSVEDTRPLIGECTDAYVTQCLPVPTRV